MTALGVADTVHYVAYKLDAESRARQEASKGRMKAGIN
jgi:hypothetical protein